MTIPMRDMILKFLMACSNRPEQKTDFEKAEIKF